MGVGRTTKDTCSWVANVLFVLGTYCRWLNYDRENILRERHHSHRFEDIVAEQVLTFRLFVF